MFAEKDSPCNYTRTHFCHTCPHTSLISEATFLITGVLLYHSTQGYLHVMYINIIWGSRGHTLLHVFMPGSPKVNATVCEVAWLYIMYKSNQLGNSHSLISFSHVNPVSPQRNNVQLLFWLPALLLGAINQQWYAYGSFGGKKSYKLRLHLYFRSQCN